MSTRAYSPCDLKSTNNEVDVQANRSATKYPPSEQILRILWGCVYPFFRYSPRILFSWRSFLLRLFGGKIGRDVHVCPSAKIFFPWLLTIGDQSAVDDECLLYNLGPLEIGKRVTISRGAFLCGGTHDYRDSSMPLIRAAINIGDDCWICAQAYIGPHVTIHEAAVVGARAVVTHDVARGNVVAGNPARIINDRSRL